jgi:plastocyanin
MTPASQKQPALHSVRIQIRGNGFAYTTPEHPNAATIHVRPGDKVKWNCDHGNYTVLFKGESPFEEVAVHGRKSADTAVSVVTGKYGSYKYAVTVALADGGLIVDDPEIIIDGD